MNKTKYFVLVEGGRISGYYPSDIYDTPPDGSFEISEAQWLDNLGTSVNAYDGEAFYVAPHTASEMEPMNRAWRDSMLASTDKYMMPDFPISSEQQVEVRAYRQQLRDYDFGGIRPEPPLWL